MTLNENLIEAILNRNLDGVNIFISQGANVNRFKHNRMSPLVFTLYSICPSESGEVDEIISRLIDEGANVNARHKSSRMTATMMAIKKKRSDEIVFKFINAGADISLKSRWHQTTLMHAIINNCGKPVIRALLDKGSDVNIGHNNKTPFYYALCVRKDPDIIEMVLKAGAYINGSRFTKPLLALCCQDGCKIDEKCNYKRVTDILIRRGVNINERDHYGNTIIHLSICNYILFLAQRQGVSVDEENYAGVSPLLQSLLDHKGHKIIDLLLIGADPNWRDSRGNTPLHYSDGILMKSYIILLLYHGANFLAINNADMTPINSNFRICHLLSYKNFILGTKSLIIHSLLYEDKEGLNDGIQRLKTMKIYDHWKSQFFHFINFCQSEVDDMRDTLLTDELSIYQFCHLKRYYHSRYIPIQIDQYLIDHDTISKKFEVFKDVIFMRLQDNSRKNFKQLLLKMLYYISVSVVSPAHRKEFISELIYDCLYLIGKYLNYRQLYALIEASLDQ